MKRILLITLLALTAATTWAVPAKRGQWKTIQLSDGTEIKAEKVGDEWGHWWRSEEGVTYVETETKGIYERKDETILQTRAQSKRYAANQRRRERRKANFGGQNQDISGSFKGLIILVNFQDVKFKVSKDPKSLYTNIANKEGYSEGNFVGSVYDYFKAQSLGKFLLNFDVIGPVTVRDSMAYYGGNDEYGDDMHPAEMVIEAIHMAKDSVDFADYDWDGNGEVDQVFIVYAGKGEASSYIDDTIWPHEWDLEAAAYYGDGTGSIDINGLTINTYACGPELNGYGKIDGIGTICHEFSHCLGYPDMYDTSKDGNNYGMMSWDLMDDGSYNGDGYCPAGYTSYERKVAGWITPTEITGEINVNDMQALQSSGEAYIIYNQAHPDEYYLLENRQKTGWDSELPGHGMLILHIDYDEEIWMSNTPNVGDIEHACPFKADNNEITNSKGLAGDTYPYSKEIKIGNRPITQTNDSLTKHSTPAATLNNPNADGSNYMHIGILKIKENADGTMSFQTTTYETSGIETIEEEKISSPVLYNLYGQRMKQKDKGIFINDGKLKIQN